MRPGTVRAARHAARAAIGVGERLAAPIGRWIRFRYYVEDGAGWLARSPRGLRRLLGIDDKQARDGRRVEVGCGPYPSLGYVHVDVDPRARHLEAVAPAWTLPFPDAWAREVLAIHALEHIPPPRLLATLREWYRVLLPGGKVRIHVPNAPALFDAYIEASAERKWPVIGAILGMYPTPNTRSPDELVMPSDHQLLFDADLLSWAMATAGFVEIEDLTGDVEDRHTEAWAQVVPRISLVMTGRRDRSSA